MIYFGICESRDDPLKLGRIQVRVFGLHNENTLKIPTKDLPWASIIQPGSSISGIGTSSSILEGSMVAIMFVDGESKQIPIVLGSIHGIPQTVSIASAPFSDDIVVKNTNTSEPEVISEPSPLVDLDKPIEEQAPVVEITPNDQVGYPTAKQIEDMKVKLGFKESSNNYKAENRFGFIGKYQFGRDRLVDLGYINRDAPKGNKAAFDNQSSWVGKDGIRSKQDWFNNPTVQEKVMNESYKLSFNRLKKLGVLKDSTPTKEIAGYITTAHLLGEGAAKKQSLGISGSDANGVTGEVYFNLGYSSITGEDQKPEEKVAASATSSEPIPSSAPKETSITSGTEQLAKTNSEIGFKDPNGKYPFLLKEQDTNRLARRVTSGTLVDQKNTQRTQGIRSIGGTFSQPPSPYNAVYPFNQVFYTESGHALEFDDTTNNRRINLFHASGTFTEIDTFGNRVNKIIGDTYEIIDRNGYISIGGTARITINGDAKIVVGGNANLEVDGSMVTDVGGDYQLKVGGNISVQSGGKSSIRAGGQVGIDGSQVFFNSGVADSIGVSARGGESVDFEPNLPEPFTSEITYVLDDADPETVNAYYERAIKTGEVKQEEVDAGKEAAKNPEVVDDKNPPVSMKPLPSDCSMFNSLDKIPDTLKISKYFTIGSCTTNATFPNKLSSYNGLSEKDIACNLKRLCENVLDPIKEKFPTMFITSSFRPKGSKSQHTRGEAADMQFRGFSKADYFNAAQWIRDNVLFDQLLLEYKTTGSGLPWIHVTFTANPRRDVQTFMNDSSVGKGLRKLQ